MGVVILGGRETLTAHIAVQIWAKVGVAKTSIAAALL